MGVNFQIASTSQGQINHGMFGEQAQHMVEEGDAGVEGGFPGAVDVQPDGDSGFFGDTFDLG
jgi:hypothetical protein